MGGKKRKPKTKKSRHMKMEMKHESSYRSTKLPLKKRGMKKVSKGHKGHKGKRGMKKGAKRHNIKGAKHTGKHHNRQKRAIEALRTTDIVRKVAPILYRLGESADKKKHKKHRTKPSGKNNKHEKEHKAKNGHRTKEVDMSKISPPIYRTKDDSLSGYRYQPFV